MSTQLQQAQKQRHEAIESNRDLGLISYQGGGAQSDKVYEVIDGHHRLPDGQVLGPGQRFKPTARQLRGNTLRGKARELTNSEYRDVKATRPMVAGADFREMGLRALPMADSTVEYAIQNGLTADDFEGVEAEGAAGRYTRAQVEAMVAAKSTD